ncbi:cellulase family glycosylhydrolase [Anaerosporobacter sp.]|uniref:cellulase family glycosylhydrolase n=1 Tax=Anaerosporobacter sp. TaxID=1872529 RepID=UPI00286F1F69|nr:cellulase family glycosylhydrolase [Anaerosporobacter sp.]
MKFGKLLKTGLSVALCVSMLAASFVPSPKKTEAATTGFTQDDFLKTNGTTIRNLSGQGDVVYLRGTNAGGWLVQEDWMNPTNAKDQKTMMNTFKTRFGTTVRDELINVYESNYWTTQDFDNCAALGMSAIRLPFTYMNLCDDNGNLKSNAFEKLDWFVNNCNQRGMYVILDLHGTFGSQNGMDHSGEINDGKQLYWNSYNRSKTVWLWEEIAKHYKGNPAVAAYDILNEPGIKAANTYDLHWTLYDEIYKAIRKVDSDHIVIMESCWGTSNLPKPTTYGWTNVMYEYHHYPWNAVSDYNGQVSACNNFVNSVKNAGYNVPTFVGEFTCFELANAWDYVLNSFNSNGLHYTSWAYKATGNSSWGIYNHNPNKVDIYNDSAATIRTKWSTIGAGQSWANTTIYNAMKSKLPGTVTPYNKQSSEYISIQSSANGKYVCAEDEGASPLVANRDSAGGWEQFKVVYNSDNTVSFQSSANGKYLCAVIDESNQLLARSAQIGTWEKFKCTAYGSNEVIIQAVANNKYISVNTGNSILYADGSNTSSANVRFTMRSNGAIYMPTGNSIPDPVRIEAESYSNMYGVQKETCSEGGQNVGYIDAGDWMEYKVEVPKNGSYMIRVRGAALGTTGNVDILYNNTLMDTVTIQATGGWQTWNTFSGKKTFTLSKGTYTMRVQSQNGGCNINWLELVCVQ